MCVPLLDAIRFPRGMAGPPGTTPDAVLGDRAYSKRVIRAELRRRGIVAVIPNRTSKGGRALATRYDKHARTYRGAIILAAIFTWTRV